MIIRFLICFTSLILFVYIMDFVIYDAVKPIIGSTTFSIINITSSFLFGVFMFFITDNIDYKIKKVKIP